MPLGRRAGLWLACALLALLGAWHAVVAPLGPLKRLEWLTDDLRTRALASAQTQPNPDIVIVDIDDASLRSVGRWPWGRDRLATLARELFERQHIAALGFDLVFSEADTGDLSTLRKLAATDPTLAAHLPTLQQALDHDRPLAQALNGQPAVLGWYLTADRGGVRAGLPPAFAAEVPAGAATPGLPRWSGYAASLPVLAAAAPRAGFFNALPDDDGVVRSVAAVARLDGRLYESLALALWRCATGDPDVQFDWRRAPGQPRALELAALRYGAVGAQRHLTPDERGALRVPFRGAGGPVGGSFRYLSASEVLAGHLPEGNLAGRLVLLGSSAPGLADLRATPIHTAMPGVEVHAHLLAGLLDGDLPQRPSWAPGYEALLTALLLVLVTVFAIQLPAPLALGAMATLVAAVVGATAWAQGQAQQVLPEAAALALAGLQFALAVGTNYVHDWQRRKVLVDLFSTYLPPERVQQLVRSADANTLTVAENRELSVLFCDLQGFSGLAEKLPPLALRDLLNQYFSETSAVVHAHGGTLDKFIGDAVMAFWGAPLPQPDHAVRAVRAAIALEAQIAPLNQHLQRQGLPPVRYGIGLATGLVCVGDLGSRLRRSYTAVGDAVNLSARLEALTREVGVGLLVADTTRQACAEHLPDVVWLEVEECLVKGRDQPVTLFTPIVPSVAARPTIEAEVRIWQLALSAARQHHIGPALAQLARLNELNALHPQETPAVLARLSLRLQARLSASGGHP